MGQDATAQRHCVFAIDDEEGLLRLVKVALECQGYTVHTASSSQEAIELYEKNWRDIGMVFLDFVLPHMPGDQVFAELPRLNPDVRVVLLTGCEESVADKLFQKGLRGFLQKPFNLSDLALQAQNAINASPLTPPPSPVPA
jgi:two-component system, cell cycle sensor histidine kinase and response regulator CckA